jgi:hypothetical protein
MSLDAGTRPSTIDQLLSFLHGELAAVQRYDRAIPELSDVGEQALLDQCVQSHLFRVRLLREEIARRGASMDHTQEAAATRRPSEAPEEKAPIAALAECERCVREAYERKLDDLDEPARKLVTGFVRPEQWRTYQAVHALERGYP